MLFAKSYAKALLKVHFVRSFFERFLGYFLRDKSGKRFFQSYGPLGWMARSQDEVKLLIDSEGCLNCSLCALSCSAIRQGVAPPGFEPKHLVLAASKSSQDCEIFLEEWMPCVQCTQCTADCPTHVPLHALAEQIQSNRNRLGFRSKKSIIEDES